MIRVKLRGKLKSIIINYRILIVISSIIVAVSKVICLLSGC